MVTGTIISIAAVVLGINAETSRPRQVMVISSSTVARISSASGSQRNDPVDGSVDGEADRGHHGRVVGGDDAERISILRLLCPAGEVGASGQGVGVLKAQDPLLDGQQGGELVARCSRVPRFQSPGGEVTASCQGVRVIGVQDPFADGQQGGELVARPCRLPADGGARPRRRSASSPDRWSSENRTLLFGERKAPDGTPLGKTRSSQPKTVTLRCRTDQPAARSTMGGGCLGFLPAGAVFMSLRLCRCPGGAVVPCAGPGVGLASPRLRGFG